MKILLLVLSSIVWMADGYTQNVGIGTATPNPSALLDVTSTTQGVLVPRMTEAQRNAITDPATGLLIFQSDAIPGFYYNNGTAAQPAWLAIGNGSTWSLMGNSNTNPASNFIGTSDFQPLILKVNNQKAGFIAPDHLNTYFGYQALNANTSTANTAFGYQALYLNSTGISNTASGYHALHNNSIGSYNTAYGTSALKANTTASNNTATGSFALSANTGSNNTAHGTYTLRYNTSGSGNTANGNNALQNNNTGNANTAVGDEALSINTAGSYNTAIGQLALDVNTGNTNTGVGFGALRYTTGSSGNTAIGSGAGDRFNYGFNNTFIGQNAEGDFADQYNSVALGYDAVVYGNNEAIIGNGLLTYIGGAVNWSAFSDGRFKKNLQENVPGLAFIKRLKPVTYRFDVSGLYDFFHKDKPNENYLTNGSDKLHELAIRDKEKIVYTGFVAQEVEKTAKQLGFEFSGVNHPSNEKGLYSLRYAEFVVPLVKGMQEQQQMIEAQNQKLDELRKEIEVLKAMINK